MTVAGPAPYADLLHPAKGHVTVFNDRGLRRGTP
jgi:hypothetical protein